MREFILGGKGNLLNGLAALLLVSMIVLGCTCNQDEGFKFGSNDKGNTESKDSGDDTTTKDSDDKKSGDSFEADEDTVPTNSQSSALVRKTLLDFNEAVKEGDFKEFHKNLAGVWRRTSKPADFEKNFGQFIEKKINIGMVADLEPDFSPKPYIKKKNGRKALFLEGEYDAGMFRIIFDLEYIVDNGVWKLGGIKLGTKS